jgi:hypothetical protein
VAGKKAPKSPWPSMISKVPNSTISKVP